LVEDLDGKLRRQVRAQHNRRSLAD
jgi:hypothetical protein